MQLADRVIVVTGAGRGNGRAISERLAEEGATVLVSDRNGEAADIVAAAIREQGGSAEAVTADVTSEDDIVRLFERARELGGPHAVVAQAGISHNTPLHETSLDAWNRHIAVDVTGTFLTVREAVRSMIPLGGGSIVTMSGTYAFQSEPGAELHSASKGAILSFTKGVAVEYGNRGIRCNTIVPGYVATEMVEEFYAKLPAEASERINKWHALGRIATPREVANLALFLCSDQSSFSTGSPFFVDGGLTAGFNSWQIPAA